MNYQDHEEMKRLLKQKLKEQQQKTGKIAPNKETLNCWLRSLGNCVDTDGLCTENTRNARESE